MSARWAAALLALASASFSGCLARWARLPYDAAWVVPPPTPAHPGVVALVKLRDARPADEAPDSGGRYVYRGREYRGTNLDALGVDPLMEVTVAVARHLARARVFARVLVVERPERAPEADLVLSGELVRLRGFVEASRPPDAEVDVRSVVAEAHLARLTVADRRGGAALARFDVGYAFHDVRPGAPEPPDPWAVAAEVLAPTVDQLVEGLRGARLDGSVRVGPAAFAGPAELGALTSTSARGAELEAAVARLGPPGWIFTSSAAATPRGWRATGSCAGFAWRSSQERGFDRARGPYVPSVELWACAEGVGLTWDARADDAALYLGREGGGRRWLARQVGASRWPDALPEFARLGRLAPPAERHLFRLGPGPVERR